MLVSLRRPSTGAHRRVDHKVRPNHIIRMLLLCYFNDKYTKNEKKKNRNRRIQQTTTATATTHSHVILPDWILSLQHFPCSFECQTVSCAVRSHRNLFVHECASHLYRQSALTSAFDTHTILDVLDVRQCSR